MKMSIIIVAYKNSDILRKCLNSIDKYNDLNKELEVIVVDNSPPSERVEVPKQLNTYHLQYIPADNNGFGAGNNIGANTASGEVLAFLNPDIILIEPIFNYIYNLFSNDASLALLGCKLLDENLCSTFSFYYDYKITIRHKYLLKVYNKLNIFDSKTMFTSGADMFVSASVFKKIGMFDENIFMYYEEPDLNRRIKSAFPNALILYDKKIKMIHLEKRSTPNSVEMLGHELDSSIYYGKKYNLPFKEKIKFDFFYNKIKMVIYYFTNKAKAEEIKKKMEYMQKNYSKYLTRM